MYFTQCMPTDAVREKIPLPPSSKADIIFESLSEASIANDI